MININYSSIKKQKGYKWMVNDGYDMERMTINKPFIVKLYGVSKDFLVIDKTLKVIDTAKTEDEAREKQESFLKNK